MVRQEVFVSDEKTEKVPKPWEQVDERWRDDLSESDPRAPSAEALVSWPARKKIAT